MRGSGWGNGELGFEDELFPVESVERAAEVVKTDVVSRMIAVFYGPTAQQGRFFDRGHEGLFIGGEHEGNGRFHGRLFLDGQTTDVVNFNILLFLRHAV